MSDAIVVAAPSMCPRHFRNLTRHMGARRWAKWLELEKPDAEQTIHALGNAMLVAQLARTEAVVKRAERDASNLTLVFAELGCLACYSPADYWKVLKIMERGPAFAANVIQVADFGSEAWELPDV